LCAAGGTEVTGEEEDEVGLPVNSMELSCACKRAASSFSCSDEGGAGGIAFGSGGAVGAA